MNSLAGESSQSWQEISRAKSLQTRQHTRRCNSRQPAYVQSQNRVAAVISRFFIDRPIFAAVLSIVITLAGAIAVSSLPDRPVSATSRRRRSRSPATIRAPAPRWWPTPWPRRSSSRSTAWRACSTCRRSASNDGSYNLTVTFDLGSDLNTALVHGAEPRRAGHAAVAQRGAAAGRERSRRSRPTSCWW